MENKRYPNLCSKEYCTGCGACDNACPQNAITLLPHDDGFYYPNINKSKCIKCLLCETSCPVINLKESSNFQKPYVYACWNKDKNIRNESSSGGAFSAIAMYILKKGGYVVGAVYDESMNVKHVMIDSVDDLHKLRGSKYVQSRIGNIFTEIKLKLKSGKLIFFVGTPCQVSGLKFYLKKEYDNLICCDFICHGVPSPLLFNKYINWLETTQKEKIKDFNFRNKIHGWYDALRVVNKEKIIKGKYDSYFFGFNKNITLRESCYICPSIGLPRKGDITFADFWGIGMKYKYSDSDINKGISLVMANNEKGKYIINCSKQYMNIKERPFDEAIERNKPMIYPSNRPQIRDIFYKDLNKTEFEDLRKKYLKISGKSFIVATFRENTYRQFIIMIRNIVQYLTWKKNGSKTL